MIRGVPKKMLAVAGILLLLASCSLDDPKPYLQIDSVYHLDYTWMIGNPDEQKVVVEATWHDESLLAEFEDAPSRVDASCFRISINGVAVTESTLVDFQQGFGFADVYTYYLRVEPRLKVGDTLFVGAVEGKSPRVVGTGSHLVSSLEVGY